MPTDSNERNEPYEYFDPRLLTQLAVPQAEHLLPNRFKTEKRCLFARVVCRYN